MTQLIKLLRKMNLFDAKSLSAIVKEISTSGINIGSLLGFATRLFNNHTTIVYEEEAISYHQLRERSLHLAHLLSQKYHLAKGQKLAIACANHPPLLYSIFAAGYLGLDIYLLPYDMKENQFAKQMRFDFCIYDTTLQNIINKYYDTHCSLSELDIENIVSSETLFQQYNKKHLPGHIVVLTAGTTGMAKTVSRKTNPSAFISPFIDIFNALELYKYNSVYVATPIYHGFGLCTLFISIILGKEIHLTRKFDTLKASHLIKNNAVECITLVPSILQRLLDHDPEKLKTIRCIVTGGAPLPSTLVKQVQQHLGNILFNLYGTSEAGFCIMATPKSLEYNSETIGKPIRNVQLQIDGQNVEQGKTYLGSMSIKCKWSAKNNAWVETGDIIQIDKLGYLFFKGRTDDMIVSGGENVYPYELEDSLLAHPSIAEAAAIGVSDDHFGQRLIAFVVLKAPISMDDLKLWVSNNIIRYQIPREIITLAQLPKNQVGKIDKNSLKHHYEKNISR